MRIRAFKYASPLVLYWLAYWSFTAHGFITFFPLLWSYTFIPLLELLLTPDTVNMSSTQEEIAAKDKVYDYLLYTIPVLQYAALVFFLFSLRQPDLTWIDYAGRISAMGLLCGIFGINVGHELGHRKNKMEQWFAKGLLLSSQYMHFFIEHNRGHHKRVATWNDPATARFNEWLFSFYFRSIVYSYTGAWKIANSDMRKRDLPVSNIQNSMVQYTIIQVVFNALIILFFGWIIWTCYLLAAAMGIALLETVNYIEHYGLQRKEVASGKYERALPHHSWNSNHVLGRLMLFELSRHSDHHYQASRKYQLLRHHDNSPQMPTGYPGMMILAHVPPLFIYIMNKRIKQLQQSQAISTKAFKTEA